MKYTDCMIDLETLDTKPTAAVLQIGWCFFDCNHIDNETASGNVLLNTTHPHQVGRTISSDTMKWWREQNPETVDKVFSGRTGEDFALLDFKNYWNKYATEHTWVWAQGAAFDFPILESLHDYCDLEQPFNFWQQRCSRTLMAMFPHIERRQPEIAHDAESDSIAQAHTVQLIFEHLKKLATSNEENNNA